MKQSQDPFEAALMEQEKSPPESPMYPDENETQNPTMYAADAARRDDDFSLDVNPSDPQPSWSKGIANVTSGAIGDPDKREKMQAMLSQFTEEQMNRYESFRRSGFQRANMKRLLVSITGSSKISVPMTIVVSGIAKMFVGELVETARVVMTERKDSGSIRPCHIREANRRLKLEGKVPKRSVSRLFR
ncbi:general transcription factor [Lithospermum erythrorhizon]|uniref:General transcription factor n=1 Tax=Lithospermum erythrorhizon TaxID=34254 RepID=A0AAV3QHM9_LITER